jgi:hypothetical protein
MKIYVLEVYYFCGSYYAMLRGNIIVVAGLIGELRPKPSVEIYYSFLECLIN